MKRPRRLLFGAGLLLLILVLAIRAMAAGAERQQEEEKMPERERHGMKQGGKKADMSQGKNRHSG